MLKAGRQAQEKRRQGKEEWESEARVGGQRKTKGGPEGKKATEGLEGKGGGGPPGGGAGCPWLLKAAGEGPRSPPEGAQRKKLMFSIPTGC